MILLPSSPKKLKTKLLKAKVFWHLVDPRPPCVSHIIWKTPYTYHFRIRLTFLNNKSNWNLLNIESKPMGFAELELKTTGKWPTTIFKQSLGKWMNERKEMWEEPLTVDVSKKPFSCSKWFVSTTTTTTAPSFGKVKKLTTLLREVQALKKPQTFLWLKIV